MATLRVNIGKDVSNFVIKRTDGHELSLSSYDNSLIEWNGSEAVADYGRVYSVENFLETVHAFIVSKEN